MRIRHLTILAPLLLCGCGVPPAIALASYAADGLLLVTTGKSSTDHALSFATGEDCAMWRVVEGEAVCTELSPEGGGQIALAADGEDPTDTAGEPIRQAATAPRGAVTSEALPPPGEAPAATPSAPAAVATADPALAGTLRPSDRVAPTAATGAPVALGPQAAPAGATTATATATGIAASPRVAPLAPPLAAPRLVAVAETAPAGPRLAAAPGAETRAAPPAGHYYVLASYRDRDNAARHLAKLEGMPSRIMPAEIDGVAHYRVLAGPYAPGQRAGAEARLADAGVTNHWTLDLCGGDCAGGSQLASAD